MPSNTVVLVTGSRAGLGRSLAEHYVGRDFRVVGCSRGPAPTELQDLTGYEHVECDVTDEVEVGELLAHIRHSYGGLQVLVNNAGVWSGNHVMTTPVAEVRSVIEVNLIGTFLCSRAAARVMMRSGGGHIVNLSSISVPLASVGTAIYGAAKAAVEQFSRVFAKEVAPLGVAVRCLGPSFIEGTGMAAGLDEAAAAALADSLGDGARITADEVAAIIDGWIATPLRQASGDVLYTANL